MRKRNQHGSVPSNNSNKHTQPNAVPATKQGINKSQGKSPNSFPNSPKIQPQTGKLNPQASGPFNNSNTQMPHSNGGPTTQQVLPNNCQGKPPNVLPISPQVRPQMGMFNAQAAVHFNNSNAFMPQPNGALANQQAPPNGLGNPPNFFPNPQIQSQMGMINPQMQMLFNNSNIPLINPSSIPMLGNLQNGFMMQMNTNQPFNQFFGPNCMNNFPMYQNMGFPMQNMNQVVQQPLPNNNQAVPCNMPVFPNQVPQVLGAQSQIFVPNVQLSMVPTNQPNNQNQPNLVNNVAQLAQGNKMAPLQQSQNGFRPPMSNTSQGNYGNGNGVNSPQAKWKNHQNRNFTNNPKKDGFKKGFQKNNNMQGKGAAKPYNKLGIQGHAGQNLNLADSSNQMPVQPKKNLALNYTTHEIQQWREERKKNYPSKANIDKKQGEEKDRAAALRRQQLKDVLEKQAQLGCEVAEIPSHYLYDSGKQVSEKEENPKPFGKREKFQKRKFNRRGNRQNDRFAKKQKLGENDSPNRPSQNQQLFLDKREPTLLQKLLSADIRRDKARLLQIFKFMVMNSFFKDWPQMSLSFPLVVVKGTGVESEVVEVKEEVALEESTCVSDDEIGGGNNGSSDGINGKSALLGSLNCIHETENEGEEEEGEIVD